MMQNVHKSLTHRVRMCAIISIERSVYMMKIIKLPACCVRYLYAGYVVWYEGYYYYFTDGVFYRYTKKKADYDDEEEVKIV